MPILSSIKRSTASVFSFLKAKPMLTASVLFGVTVLLVSGGVAYRALFVQKHTHTTNITSVNELYSKIPSLISYDVQRCQLSLCINTGTRALPGPSIVDLWGVVELSPAGATQLRDAFKWEPESSYQHDTLTKTDIPRGVELLRCYEFEQFLDRQTPNWMIGSVHIEADPSSTKLYLTFSKG